MKLTKIFLAILAIFAISCVSESGTTEVPNGGGSTDTTKWEEEGSIVGVWELIKLNGSTKAKPRIYMSLNEDGSFDLYQQADKIYWVYYSGRFSFENNLLKGSYSDGVEWSSEYTVSFATEPTRIRLVSNKEKSIYTAVDEIPQWIVDEARQPEVETTISATRSVAVERFL